jgi:hypothetical protein
MTRQELIAQANRYQEIAATAREHSNVYSFNRAAYLLWQDIARAALRLRAEYVDRSWATQQPDQATRVWDGTGELRTEQVSFSTRDGTLRGRPYVRARAVAFLAQKWASVPLVARQCAVRETIDNDAWMITRNGMLASAICEDVSSYLFTIYFQSQKLTAAGYAFEAYDVLQIERAGEWLDFSTLRTASEGARAVQLVREGRWDGQPASFRIRRGFNRVVFSR